MMILKFQIDSERSAVSKNYKTRIKSITVNSLHYWSLILLEVWFLVQEIISQKILLKYFRV